jgi:hypothetical protein
LKNLCRLDTALGRAFEGVTCNWDLSRCREPIQQLYAKWVTWLVSDGLKVAKLEWGDVFMSSKESISSPRPSVAELAAQLQEALNTELAKNERLAQQIKEFEARAEAAERRAGEIQEKLRIIESLKTKEYQTVVTELFEGPSRRAVRLTLIVAVASITIGLAQTILSSIYAARANDAAVTRFSTYLRSELQNIIDRSASQTKREVGTMFKMMRGIDPPEKSEAQPPHVVLGENGKYYPEPGYKWLSGEPGNYAVEWKTGVAHPNNPNVLTSSVPGQWIPAPGYEWVDDNGSINLRVAWKPGKAHPLFGHVLAAPKVGEWQPEYGYMWINDDPNDLTVIPAK